MGSKMEEEGNGFGLLSLKEIMHYFIVPRSEALQQQRAGATQNHFAPGPFRRRRCIHHGKRVSFLARPDLSAKGPSRTPLPLIPPCAPSQGRSTFLAAP